MYGPPSLCSKTISLPRDSSLVSDQPPSPVEFLRTLEKDQVGDDLGWFILSLFGRLRRLTVSLTRMSMLVWIPRSA